MNKLTGPTLVFMLCVVAVSFGQEEESKSYISKGQGMMGGTTSFSILHDFKNPTFSISATGGYFVGKRIAVGLDLSYFFFHYSQPDNLQSIENNTTRHSILATPITRFYLGVYKFSPFLELGYGWNGYSTKSSYGTSSIGGTFSRSHYKAGIGFNQFISKSFALEGLFSYIKTNGQAFSIDSDDYFWSLRIGVQYYLNRKQKSITKESSATFIEKGQWMLGGMIDLSSYDFDKQSFDMEAGYLLKDNFALGFRVKEQTTTYYDSFTFGPFARYYFSAKRFAPFVDGFIGWGSGESGELFQQTNPSVITMQAGAGFNYFINDFVALESQLSYGLAGFDKPTISLDAGLKFFLVQKE